MEHPTAKQISVMRVLADYTRPATTRQIADNLERPTFGSRRVTTAMTYGRLRRLRKRGLVAKVSSIDGRGPERWQLTAAGREVVAAPAGPS